MSELLVLALKFAFLALLWVMVLGTVDSSQRLMSSDHASLYRCAYSS